MKPSDENTWPALDAVWLPEHDAVYVEIPKVASSSVKLVLAQVLGIDLAPDEHNPHQARFPEPPLAMDGPRFYPGLFSFAFVRNPWDRLVSCYRDKILGRASDYTAFHPERGVAHCLARFDGFEAGMSFERFVDVVAEIPDREADPHFRSQHTFVTNRQGEVALDFVGRFESLNADFAAVCRRLGFQPNLPLPHVQSTNPKGRYNAYYTPATREAVLRRFEGDVRLFGFGYAV